MMSTRTNLWAILIRPRWNVWHVIRWPFATITDRTGHHNLHRLVSGGILKATHAAQSSQLSLLFDCIIRCLRLSNFSVKSSVFRNSSRPCSRRNASSSLSFLPVVIGSSKGMVERSPGNKPFFTPSLRPKLPLPGRCSLRYPDGKVPRRFAQCHTFAICDSCTFSSSAICRAVFVSSNHAARIRLRFSSIIHKPSQELHHKCAATQMRWSPSPHAYPQIRHSYQWSVPYHGPGYNDQSNRALSLARSHTA